MVLGYCYVMFFTLNFMDNAYEQTEIHKSLMYWSHSTKTSRHD